MTKILKKRLAITGIFILHLVTTAYFSFCVLGFILARHHNQLSPDAAAKEPLVRSISAFFEFPLIPLSRIIFGQAASALTPLLWVSNSILWAFIFYYLFSFIQQIFKRQKNKR